MDLKSNDRKNKLVYIADPEIISIPICSQIPRNSKVLRLRIQF